MIRYQGGATENKCVHSIILNYGMQLMMSEAAVFGKASNKQYYKIRQQNKRSQTVETDVTYWIQSVKLPVCSLYDKGVWPFSLNASELN